MFKQLSLMIILFLSLNTYSNAFQATGTVDSVSYSASLDDANNYFWGREPSYDLSSTYEYSLIALILVDDGNDEDGFTLSFTGGVLTHDGNDGVITVNTDPSHPNYRGHNAKYTLDVSSFSRDYFEGYASGIDPSSSIEANRKVSFTNPQMNAREIPGIGANAGLFINIDSNDNTSLISGKYNGTLTMTVQTN